MELCTIKTTIYPKLLVSNLHHDRNEIVCVPHLGIGNTGLNKRDS